MKILLVEDHPGSRRNLQRLIAKRGHDVTAVGSAEEAEAALAAETFPFLILDWMLRGKRDEVLGRVLWEQFPELIGTIFQRNYERVMAEKIAIEFEATDTTSKIWYDVHAYRSNGGVSVFFRDISERKKSETERLT